MIEIEMDELHNFVKSKTMSDNFDIKGRASLLLGLAGYDEDIPFLSSIVKSEQEGYAEEAALSLTYIHSNAAVNELRNLKMQVVRPQLKELLQKLVAQYQNMGLTECKKITRKAQ